MHVEDPNSSLEISVRYYTRLLNICIHPLFSPLTSYMVIKYVDQIIIINSVFQVRCAYIFHEMHNIKNV